MTGELFNPEAFEQMPGQMAFEQDAPATLVTLYRFVADSGTVDDIILAVDDAEAQREAAEVWQGVPGAIYRTERQYQAQRVGGMWRACDAR